MKLMSSLLSGLLVLTALLIAFTSFVLDEMVELYAPIGLDGNRISLLENQRKGELLSREAEITYRRIRSKAQIVEALRSGEISLSEAAGGFRALHEDPRSWHNPLYPRPVHDDGLSWCREVIEWATSTVCVERSYTEAESMRQHLEAELQEQLDYLGSVTLPD